MRLLTLLALFLLGCASPKYIVWDKPGLDPAQFKRDTYRCTQESRTSWSGGGSGLIGLSLMASAQRQAVQEANKLYWQCMEAAGYTGRPARPEEIPR